MREKDNRFCIESVNVAEISENHKKYIRDIWQISHSDAGLEVKECRKSVIFGEDISRFYTLHHAEKIEKGRFYSVSISGPGYIAEESFNLP